MSISHDFLRFFLSIPEYCLLLQAFWLTLFLFSIKSYNNCTFIGVLFHYCCMFCCSSNTVCSLATSKSSQHCVNLLSHINSTLLLSTAIVSKLKEEMANSTKLELFLTWQVNLILFPLKASSEYFRLNFWHYSERFMFSTRCNLLGNTCQYDFHRVQCTLHSHSKVLFQFTGKDSFFLYLS